MKKDNSKVEIIPELPEQNVIVIKPYSEIIRILLKDSVVGALAFGIATGADFIAATMLSRIDQETLAASGLITILLNALKGSACSVFLITNPLVAEFIGKIDEENKKATPDIVFIQKQSKEAGKILRHCYLFSSILAVPIMGMFFFSEDILILCGQPANVANIVQQYFRAYTPGLPGSLLFMTTSQAIWGIKGPNFCLAITMVQKALMLSIGYFLMFGAFGAPQLEAAGLGLANTISTWTALLGGWIYLASKKEFKAFKLFSPKGFSLQLLAKVAKKGFPVGIQTGAVFLGNLLSMIMIGWEGEVALAASEVAFQFYYLCLIPILALAQTISREISKQVKKENDNEDITVDKQRSINIRRFNHAATALGLVPPAALFLCDIIIPNSLTSLFMDTSTEENQPIVDLTQKLLLIAGIGLLLNTIRNIDAGSLRGVLDTTYAMCVSVASTLILGLPLSYLASEQFDLGTPGIFMAMTVISMFASTALIRHRWVTKSAPQENGKQNCCWPKRSSTKNDAKSQTRCCGFFDRKQPAEKAPLINEQPRTKNWCVIL